MNPQKIKEKTPVPIFATNHQNYYLQYKPILSNISLTKNDDRLSIRHAWKTL